MDTIRSLLIPLALIFAAVATFEFGARYGAANMRAYAIAGELQFPLHIYAQTQTSTAASSGDMLTLYIDTRIGSAAVHRQLWYLKSDASAALDKVLTYALSLRGDAAINRFEQLEANDERLNLSPARLTEIREALADARVELVENAPEPQQEKSVETDL
jgi:hypothetical protein